MSYDPTKIRGKLANVAGITSVGLAEWIRAGEGVLQRETLGVNVTVDNLAEQVAANVQNAELIAEYHQDPAVLVALAERHLDSRVEAKLVRRGPQSYALAETLIAARNAKGSVPDSLAVRYYLLSNYYHITIRFLTPAQIVRIVGHHKYGGGQYIDDASWARTLNYLKGDLGRVLTRRAARVLSTSEDLQRALDATTNRGATAVQVTKNLLKSGYAWPADNIDVRSLLTILNHMAFSARVSWLQRRGFLRINYAGQAVADDDTRAALAEVDGHQGWYWLLGAGESASPYWNARDLADVFDLISEDHPNMPTTLTYSPVDEHLRLGSSTPVIDISDWDEYARKHVVSQLMVDGDYTYLIDTSSGKYRAWVSARTSYGTGFQAHHDAISARHIDAAETMCRRELQRVADGADLEPLADWTSEIITHALNSKIAGHTLYELVRRYQQHLGKTGEIGSDRRQLVKTVAELHEELRIRTRNTEGSAVTGVDDGNQHA